ncbi:hypothetical protein FLWE109334_12545 [Flavobacterium weaverense]|uniref:Uncharacterized protein n=1 Tax=Flavobacterium weaverense TaxID=271156 RepID=A0A3L9ZRP6_9FLAO|nr:hypothetical protein BC961_2699 [Flavobacterium weaverense]
MPCCSTYYKPQQEKKATIVIKMDFESYIPYAFSSLKLENGLTWKIKGVTIN